ncbi:proprotein convertase subtilisin/kexin type 5-like [Anguilla rostrata]|uniref:proprotein convertase subtilisin/kexin type 5-like n=1 Tax=Anguilla rostrata TaxID=7938 RepID=UPI0030D5CEF5
MAVSYPVPIPPHGVLRVAHEATGCGRRPRHRVRFLEHVAVRATVAHPRRGRLSINLVSPSGTKSRLLDSRPFDRSADGFQNWEFMTTHCWGEQAAGNWTLEIYDSPSQPSSQEAAGKLKEWSLVFYGTSGFPYTSVRHQQPRSAELPAEDDQEYSGPCDPECDEFGCEGPGAHQCIGCLHHFLKNRNNTRTCVLACPSGFYADNRGRCKKCYFLCETCVGSRRDQCTSCKPGYHAQEGSGSCVSGCGDGYYLDGSVCRKCSENCVKCTSSDVCTECAPGTSLHGSLCHRSCEPGSFYSRERKECEACDGACASCTGSGKGECTTCAEGFLLEDRMCVPSCSNGFYPVMHLGTCNRCDPSCLTCVGPRGTCSSCVSGLTLQSGTCVHISDCRDGEYQDESGGCRLCDLTCHQCKGPESWDCISCTPGRALEEGRCDTGCSPGKYASEGQCQLCDLTCGECSDGGPENCTSCEKDKSGAERFLFRGRCVDVCPERHFRSEGRTCDPCPESCGACSGPNWCLSCNSSSYRLSDGVCTRLECGEGEVEDPEYGECMVCEEGCRKCVLYNPRHCLSCTEGFYQFQDSCYKTCPAKTYSVEDEMTCVRCPETCVSCDVEECFWCEADLFLSDGQCVEQCEEGYYGDEESQECERCHDDCKTCSGPDEDDCDSCEEEEQLAGGECVREQDPCPRNSFLNDEGECESCHSSCESCWGNERNQCSTCGRGRFLTAQQTCVGKCPVGSFGGGASRRCEPCPPGCALCAETGVCLRCHSGHRDPLYLQEGQCVRQCQRGYPAGQVCLSCASACSSCEGNATRCLSCADPFVLHRHRCAEDCPPGHLPREGRCHPCPPACRRCAADDLCEECEESHVLYEGDCVEDCPAGFYRNVEEKACVQCAESEQSQCRSCAEPGSVWYDGECLSDCPSSTYNDVHTGECKDCEDSCLTCVGPGASQCSSCREGLTLDGEGRCVPVPACPPPSYRDPQGRCQPCHSHCAHCSGPGKLSCLSCNRNHFLLNGSCLDDCPVGFFRDAQLWRCEPCHPSCRSCMGRLSQHCLTCTPHLFRQDKQCVDTCRPSFYGNASTGACEPCDPSCGECSGGGDARCLSCPDGRLYLRTHGRCRPSCPPGHYPDTRERTCESCHPSCRTCTDKGLMACDSCHGGYRLSGGVCESPCITGQYPVSESATLRCERCDASCLACRGPSSYNCTLCPALDLLTTEGRCLPCCGNETHNEMPECCNCTETRGQCVLSTNSALHNMDDSTGSPTLFVTASVLLLLGLGTIFFLIWRGRSKRQPDDAAQGYEKLGGPRRQSGDAAAMTRHRGQPLVDLAERDDDDDDEDIVYMSRDGTVYRKFRYGQPGDQEEGELELSTRKYSFP